MFTDGFHEVTLSSMNEGTLEELFKIEMAKVLKNIHDPETEVKTVREITLKVKLIPHADRQSVAVQLSAVSKLAPTQAVTTMIFIGTEKGKLAAFESSGTQGNLDLKQGKVKRIGGHTDA